MVAREIALVDIHCHLQDARYEAPLGEIIDRAHSQGVDQMVCCATDESDWHAVARIASEFSSVVPCFGIHPWYLEKRSPTWLATLTDLLLRFPQAGVGEIGIDGMQNPCPLDAQEEVFEAQLALAREMNRPVNVHCRKGWDRLLGIVNRIGLPSAGGILHSFGGSVEILHSLLAKGFSISYSGSITHPRSKRSREACRHTPLDRLLLETDSPDIVPFQKHGQLNEPASLLIIAKEAAVLRDERLDQVAEATNRNARRLFTKGTER